MLVPRLAHDELFLKNMLYILDMRKLQCPHIKMHMNNVSVIGATLYQETHLLHNVMLCLNLGLNVTRL